MARPHIERVLTHPRTSAVLEVLHAGHSIHVADSWLAVAIYLGILVVALAHLVWAHTGAAS